MRKVKSYLAKGTLSTFSAKWPTNCLRILLKDKESLSSGKKTESLESV